MKTIFISTESLNETIREMKLVKKHYPDFDENKISDGYHTFDELYEFRKLYNALAFEYLHRLGLTVYKSWKHSDGELCFGGGWFIVTALLPDIGQISNHYKAEDWDLFRIHEVDIPMTEYDGHTSQDVMDRLRKFLGSPIRP